MGNSSQRATLIPQQDPKIYFQADLPKFVTQSKIGNGKFMKTWLMKIDGILMTVKVYLRPNSQEDELLIQQYALKLSSLWKTLSPAQYPNLLPYQAWVRSVSKAKGSPVYLIRQYLNSNLYDRLSTRPFLHDFEKLWIIFQLFKCVEICHHHKIVHGDIKPENVMCTTWNWIVLTDFALFKPPSIPDDDPSDFQYFFDTMGRRRCSVAPERFSRRKIGKSVGDEIVFDVKDADSKKYAARTVLSPEMDIFSLGCTIAEIFLDGNPLLDLPGMLKYVSVSSQLERLDQDDSPAKASVQKISNRLIRKVVLDMTQRDPERRLTIRQYRMLLQGAQSSDTSATSSSLFDRPEERIKPVETAFPPYFEKILYPLFFRLHYQGITPDDRISILCDSYGMIIKEVSGESDEIGDLFFKTALEDAHLASREDIQDGAHHSDTIKDIKQTSLNHARRRESLTGKENDFRQLLTLEGKNGNKAISQPADGLKNQSSVDDLIAQCRLFMKDFKDMPVNGSSSQQSSSKLSINMNSILDSASNLSEDNSNSLFFTSWGSVSSPKIFNFSSLADRHVCNSFVIIIQIIVSQYRSLKYLQCKAVSLMLLVRFGVRCTDDIIIQRIIPMLTHAMDDVNGLIRATAIRCLRVLLRHIREVSSYESNLFTSFLFPSLSKLAKDSEVIVRVAFAESIGVVAEAAKRFLDRSHLMTLNKIVSDSAKDSNVNRGFKSSNGDSDSLISGGSSGELVDSNTKVLTSDSVLIEFSYDEKLKVLHTVISGWIRDLVSDVNSFDYRRGSGLSSHESIIKRAILVDMMRLCVFFGQESTMELLLTQLLTFLNDQDWELRYAFCAKISSLCNFLGRTVTSECVLPCIENALVDVEEKVIVRAVSCLNTLIKSNLLSNMVITELVDNITPLLIHPSETIRNTTKVLVASISECLGRVYTAVFLTPKLYPNFIKHELPGIVLTEEILSLVLISPIPRRLFRMALLQRQKLIAPTISSLDLPSLYSVISPMNNANSASEPTLPMISNVPKVNETNRNDVYERESDIGFGIGTTIIDGVSTVVDLFTESVGATSSTPTSNAVTSVMQSNKYPSSQKLMSKVEALSNELTSLSENEDDSRRLAIIRKYLDRAAQEMNTKTKQWKNGINSGTSSGGVIVTLGRQGQKEGASTAIQLDDMLEVPLSSLPDHYLQSIHVPHQKFGIAYFPPIPEQTRRDMIENISKIKSVAKLRSLYGLNTRQSEAVRSVQAAAPAIPVAQMNELTPLLLAEGIISMAEIEKLKSDLPNANQTPSPPSQASNTPANQARMKIVNTSVEYTVLVKRLKALGIPPLPPDVGSLIQPDDTKYNGYIETLNTSISSDSQNRGWRPRESVLAATLIEHESSVNRIAVSQDQTFFITASSDKKAKVWQIRGIDRVAFPRSALTYEKHAGAVTDAVVIENSHSVATSSDDGTVHIWRVDMSTNTVSGSFDSYSQSIGYGGPDDSFQRTPGLTVSGQSHIRTLDSSEGSIVSLQHYNGDVCSVLIYATQKGIVHGWDMRSTKESFQYVLRPELGYPTSSAISPDRSWITIGTNKGYIALWDIRFNVMCKLWHHSASTSINRLACSKFMPSGSRSNSTGYDGAYLIVASGKNETGIWGLPEGGECLKCFRAVPITASSTNDIPLAPLPYLRPISFASHPLAPIVSAFEQQRSGLLSDQSNYPTVRSIIGRISHSLESYFLTGGSDRQIRYWDFLSPVKCYTVSGLEPTQQRPIIEAPEAYGGKLFVSYDADVPTNEAILQSQLPIRDGRGPVSPSNNFKDAILDMKSIDIPTRLLLSSSRDGTVKLWK